MSETPGTGWSRAERAIFALGLLGFVAVFLVGSVTALRVRHTIPWASLSHLNIVRELRQAGELDGAIAELQAEQRLNASDSRSDMILATLLAGSGRPGAVDVLAQASDSSFDPNVHLEYARRAAQLGRFDDVEIAIRRADTFQPESADVWTAVGQIYERTVRREQAIAAYTKALELDPGATGVRRALKRLQAVPSAPTGDPR